MFIKARFGRDLDDDTSARWMQRLLVLGAMMPSTAAGSTSRRRSKAGGCARPTLKPEQLHDRLIGGPVKFDENRPEYAVGNLPHPAPGPKA